MADSGNEKRSRQVHDLILKGADKDAPLDQDLKTPRLGHRNPIRSELLWLGMRKAEDQDLMLSDFPLLVLMIILMGIYRYWKKHVPGDLSKWRYWVTDLVTFATRLISRGFPN